MGVYIVCLRINAYIDRCIHTTLAVQKLHTFFPNWLVNGNIPTFHNTVQSGTVTSQVV